MQAKAPHLLLLLVYSTAEGLAKAVLQLCADGATSTGNHPKFDISKVVGNVCPLCVHSIRANHGVGKLQLDHLGGRPPL